MRKALASSVQHSFIVTGRNHFTCHEIGENLGFLHS